MAVNRVALKWTVGHTTDPLIPPTEFVSAKVPGAVQLDYARAHDWPAYFVGDNFKEYGWMEDVYWVYRAQLPGKVAAGSCFIAEGIDYQYEVRLDGNTVRSGEGMFRAVSVPLGVSPGSGLLEIIVYPAPKSRAAPQDRSQANGSVKPAVSYGWDFHPRLIPLGLWQDAYIECAGSPGIASSSARYTLAADLAFADIHMLAEFRDGARAGDPLRWILRDPAGAVVHDQIFTGEFPQARIERPALWWPHDQGPQNLYTSRLELLDVRGNVLDSHEHQFGLRRVELVMAPGQWDHPAGYPKSRSHPPITLKINGRAIFAKGSNWVSADIFPGTVTRERYAELLHLAKSANFNLLRMWGGSFVNKEAFFELCDVLGIMVWQEFPLACNRYPDDAGYLAVLESEAAAIVARLRSHACVVIYCGGNELFNGWSRMTDQSLALRLLNKVCYELDPLTPFLPTSPVDGMGHGNYLFRDGEGREVYQTMAGAAFTAYTEFGCPGPAPVETLRSFMPAEQLWPPREGTAWETHHGFNAWIAGTHLCLGVLEHYFGRTQTLEQLVKRGQWLQAEGFKCIFEEARRQKPACAMALNWCFNEPWPSAANHSLVAWPAVAKPALVAVGDSCRRTLASARIRRFSWTAGDIFEVDLFLLHDGPEGLAAGRVEASLELGGDVYPMLHWDYPAAAANTNVPGPTARMVLPVAETDRLILRLRVPGHGECDSQYVLHYRAEVARVGRSGARVLNV